MRHKQGNATASRRGFIERGLAACFLVIGLFAFSAPMHGQLTEAGTITGTVTDQTGCRHHYERRHRCGHVAHD